MITLLINRMPPTSIKRSYPSFLALQSVKGCGMTTLAVIYMACLNRNGRGTLQMRNWLACVLPHCGVMTISPPLGGQFFFSCVDRLVLVGRLMVFFPRLRGREGGGGVLFLNQKKKI